MSESAPVNSPLTEPTRKERRLLLIMSVIVLSIIQGGLQPTKISQLGIEFTPANITALRFILLAVYCFVLTAFWIAAYAEARVWKIHLSDTEKVVKARIDACRKHLVSAAVQRLAEMTTGIEDMRAILRDYSDHLRSGTRNDLVWDLDVAEIARNFLRTAQKERISGTEILSTLRSLGRTASHTPETPVEAGVHLAMHQNALHELVQPLLDGQKLRTRIVRSLYRRQIRQLSFDLRYTHNEVRDLRKSITEIQRYLRYAGLAASPSVPLPEVQERLNRLEEYLDTLNDFSEEERSLERLATVVLVEVFDGFREAAWALIHDLTRVSKDLERSRRRFRLQGFWEVTVPVLVGVGTLGTAVAQILLGP